MLSRVSLDYVAAQMEDSYNSPRGSAGVAHKTSRTCHPHSLCSGFTFVFVHGERAEIPVSDNILPHPSASRCSNPQRAPTARREVLRLVVLANAHASPVRLGLVLGEHALHLLPARS